jgi:hypothetical protein
MLFTKHLEASYLSPHLFPIDGSMSHSIGEPVECEVNADLVHCVTRLRSQVERRSLRCASRRFPATASSAPATPPNDPLSRAIRGFFWDARGSGSPLS